MQKRKGRKFEQEIATVLRAAFGAMPANTSGDAVLIRRGSQAERADRPDVFFERGPELLCRLWLECQDSATPTPRGKLEQAERDVKERCIRGYPIAVTHRKGAREILASMRLATLHYFEHGKDCEAPEMITMDLPSLFAVLRRAIERGRA